MIRSKSACHLCGCQQRVRAENISAVIYHGHLVGEEEAGDRKLHPVEYDVVEFCAKPTCEKVFKATKKDAREQPTLPPVKVRLAA